MMNHEFNLWLRPSNSAANEKFRFFFVSVCHPFQLVSASCQGGLMVTPCLSRSANVLHPLFWAH